MTGLLEAAIGYVDQSHRVIPLNMSENKLPWDYPAGHGLLGWPALASTNDDAVFDWFTADRPGLGIGIVTGATSGIVVLDVDPRGGGEDGYAALVEDYGPLPTTRTVLSGRGDGGRHLYFAHPGGVVAAWSPEQKARYRGVDVKADKKDGGVGHFVVAPPSLHPATGEPYRWADEGVPLAVLPAALVAVLRPTVAPATATPAALGAPTLRDREWALAALDRECASFVGLTTERNNHLNVVALRCFRLALGGLLDVAQVRARLAAAANAVGTPGVEATLDSAWRKAQADGPALGPDGEVGVWADTALPEVTIPDRGAGENPELELAKRRLRISNRARAEVAAEEATATFRPPTFDASLKEALARPRPPLPYTVEDLHPTGSNTLIAAQFKAGKTTLMMNLVRSLVDERPFLETFPVARPVGRVAYWNYELTDDQFIDYIRPLNIENTDLVAPLSLRGQGRLDLRSPAAFNWAVRWLKDQDVTALVLDPYGAAAMLVNENDNSEARAWLALVDDLKTAAGVADLWMPAHTGRGEKEAGGEHVRGATVVDDWADVRWLYTKQKASDGGPEYRYLRAEGRGVAVSEREVHYAPPDEGGYLYIGEVRSRARARAEGGLAQVLAVVGGSPGLNRKEVLDAMRGDSKDRTAALRAAIDGGLVQVRKGPKNASLHDLTPAGEAAALMG